MQSNDRISRTGRKGVSLLLTTAMSMVVFPMVGLSVNVGILYVVKTKLSGAADAAVLAGARGLSRGSSVSAQTAAAQTTAQNFFNANFPVGYLLTTSTSINTNVSQVAPNVRQVATTVTATVPSGFLGVLPSVGPTVTVAVTATANRRDTNLVMILDRSHSMALSSSCAPMIAAASGFVANFSENRDYLGMTSFANSNFPDYPIATNFNSSNPTITQMINNITCLGGTSSAMALWNGYAMLASLNQPGALNVLVFFTDGQPTALTEVNQMQMGSPCSNKTPTAVLTVGFPSSGTTPTGDLGLYSPNNGAVPIANDNTLYSDPSCNYMANPANIATDLAYVQNQDIYGNSTNTGYQPVTAAGTHLATDAITIMNASINAADNAAFRIRNGATGPGVATGLPNVVIFSIGLGNAQVPPKADFLMRVANDPGSSIFDSTKPAGMYIFAQTSSDLNDAFLRVASEVLRLAK